MCAIDALGIAPMFAQRIEVESRDPVSGETIGARVAPDGTAQWWPESAVVVAGAARGQGNACCGCCPVLNFFGSPANAERWLTEHPRCAATSSRCATPPPPGKPSSATCSHTADAR